MDLTVFFVLYFLVVVAIVVAHNLIPHDCDIAWHR